MPARYAGLFRGRAALLDSHRGYDAGALDLARAFARRLHAPLDVSTTTRLLIDLNRSLHHPRLFSPITRGLSAGEREKIIRRFYDPYRQRVERRIALAISRGRSVIHLSVHSFTPVLNGKVRRADIGILYDPRRRREHEFALAWRKTLREAFPDWIVRRNYPYLGTADGFIPFLRRRFAPDRYLGIELEVNLKHVRGDRAHWRKIQRELMETLFRKRLSAGRLS